MLYTAYKEMKPRGTQSFPMELYPVDEHHPRYQMPLHWHLDDEAIRVLSGELTLSLNAEPFVLKAGDMVLLEEGVLHGAKPTDCVYECLVFDFGFFLQNCMAYTSELPVLADRQFRAEDIENKNTPVGAILLKMFEAMEQKALGYVWEVSGLCLELFAALSRKKKEIELLPSASREVRRIRQLKQVLSYIQRHFAEPLTLENLAELVSMSPKYFCRFFSEMTGKTPIDYLNYYRVEYAADRLLNSEKSVTEIALSSGFNDLSYFVKTFKRYKGDTPKQFRKGVVSDAE